ncbi:MAG: uracil-DNA glycosylase [Ruminococcus sp.]|nr:uracil-DNA glycosylase [Ruminococcus sp.]
MDNKELWFSLIGGDLKNECERLIELTDKMRADGKVIFPEKKNILRAIESVDPKNVKAVIIGQDPYHDEGQAMGLSFSVPDGIKLPPSLRNIFKELCADTGCQMPGSGDLTAWTKQGVLLLNTVLTVEAHKANSHKKLGWQKITGAVLDACAALEQQLVFLCWGRPALELAQSAVNKSGRNDKFIIASTHPSPLSANNKKTAFPAFIGSRPFGRANAVLTQNNVEPVDWSL